MTHRLDILLSYPDIGAIDSALGAIAACAIPGPRAMPRYMKREVCSSYKNRTGWNTPMRVATDRLSEWLTKNAGLHTDSPIFAFSNGPETNPTYAKFDWHIEKWLVY
jgi:hypothetical protein